MKYKVYQFIIIMILAGGCIEPYNPEIISTDESFLVVEGLTINENGESTVKLTRSKALDDDSKLLVEPDANVIIETQPENSFTLNYTNNGIYSISGINWSEYQKCKLKIQTSTGYVYESKFVDIKKAPEIDSISWKADGDGLHIHINTHDDQNKTWYYRWEYIETAQYHSRWESPYKWDSATDQIMYRSEDIDKIYNCWRTERSTEIMLGTSSNLSKDVLQGHLIKSVPPQSWRIKIKYSLLVKQYALTKDAYDYIYNVEKSNEEIGSLFDPQPVNVQGNITCVTDPLEPVIGFFTVSSYTQKRKFIDFRELPDEWSLYDNSMYSTCVTEYIDTVAASAMNDSINEAKLIIGSYLDVMETNYLLYEPYCVDCRFRNGGTNIKPDFWE